MTQKTLNTSKSRLKTLVDAVVRHLPKGAPIDRSCIPENSLVQLSRWSSSSELRRGLAELYRAGYFGRHDVVNGYAWTLAAWNCIGGSWDEQFKLAQTQQYYEFFLSADEKAQASRILKRVLSAGETRNYVAGNPFNGLWWGYGDDPIPACPGERDFKAHFMQWLLDGGYSASEIADIVARCPPSDGPTRMEKIERYADELFGRRRATAAAIPKTILPDR